MVDYHRLDQVVTLTVAPIPDALPVLEQISTPPGTIDLIIAIFFSIPITNDHQKQFAFL